MAGRGNEAAAEERFLAARAGFLGQRNTYDAAMVSLEDLAVMYLRQGRTAEVRQLVRELGQLFAVLPSPLGEGPGVRGLWAGKAPATMT